MRTATAVRVSLWMAAGMTPQDTRAGLVDPLRVADSALGDTYRARGSLRIEVRGAFGGRLLGRVPVRVEEAER